MAFQHYKPLLSQLVMKDIKLKYRRSFLGYVWSILNPLMIMGIMVLVFSNMFRFDIQSYPVYLIIGQTIFNFVSESTNQAMWSITGNAALLKKTYVPKYIFTLSKVTSSFDPSPGVYLFSGFRNAPGSRKCIFQRYPVYLQCVPDGLDVCDTDLLSDQSAP